MKRGLKKTIGIAVSGGMDSMALAYLCKQMQEHDVRRPRFTAFVVDHRARVESTEESLRVVEMLNRLGMEARRLCLEWPDDVKDPLKLTDFESKARRLRFRALGGACAESGIGRLLLGHHEDDVAETTLFRLMRGGNLSTVHSTANIPECEGLANVDNAMQDLTSTLPQKYSKARHIDYQRPPMAKHGILIHRPMLMFSKERLKATCLRSGVPWKEDSTNQDLALTPRNAIRHLLQGYHLPRGIQKPSLLRVADKQRKSWDDADRTATDLLERSRVDFDTRSAVLMVHFPLKRAENDDVDSLKSRLTKADVLELLDSRTLEAFALLRYLARIVKPNSILGTDRMFRIAKTICDSASLQKPRPFSQTYTSAGIQWALHCTSNDWTWKLSRQPPATSRVQESCVWPRDKLGAWQLFDGRFWIRLAEPLRSHAGQQLSHDVNIMFEFKDDLQPPKHGAEAKSSSIILQNDFQVCFLSKDGLHFFRQQLRDSSPEALEDFNASLTKAAAGNIRWTLPAITPIGASKHVLALPTLGWQIPSLPDMVHWQVQYAYTVVPRGHLEEAR